MFKKISSIINRIIDLCPSWLFGSPEVIKTQYSKGYGFRNWTNQIDQIRRRTAMTILALTLMLLVLIILAVSESLGNIPIKEINRPYYGKDKQQYLARVYYKGQSIEQKVSLTLTSVEATDEEKKRVLNQYCKQLPNIILGENDSLQNVNRDLALPIKNEKLGINIEWFSDQPDLINEKGQLDTISALKGGEVRLTAILSLGDCVEEYVIYVKVPASQGGDHSRALKERLNRAVTNLEEEFSSEHLKDNILYLPDKINGDITIEWFNYKDNPYPAASALVFFLIILVFFRRYSGFQREFKLQQEEIRKDLPDFIDKLILLLNAGLVTESAFNKITTDYQKIRNKSRPRALYEGLCEVNKRINESNASFFFELEDFARDTGIKELTRCVYIIRDNLSKGSSLIEKLEKEAGILWMLRKKNAEEKCKAVETKLTFPLLLLLAGLIIISTGPVLISF